MKVKISKKKLKKGSSKKNVVKEKINLSDIPELGNSFFKNAELKMPENKESVSLRLDSDVLDWFRHQGKGYQTRINAILRTYMNAKTH